MKKYIAKKDLEEAIAQKPSLDDCPDVNCRQHFFGSSVAREAHKSLYPSHFKDSVTPSLKIEAAVTENLNGKVTHAKKMVGGYGISTAKSSKHQTVEPQAEEGFDSPMPPQTKKEVIHMSEKPVKKTIKKTEETKKEEVAVED